jgi:hypothetical protein
MIAILAIIALSLGGLFVLALIGGGRAKPNPDFPERE